MSRNNETIAHQMAMEYFIANDKFVRNESQIEEIVKEFVSIENAFYNALQKNAVAAKKFPNPV